MKTPKNIVRIAFALKGFASLGITTTLRAVNPPPDGNYPGGNTAEGQNALLASPAAATTPQWVCGAIEPAGLTQHLALERSLETLETKIRLAARRLS